MASAAEMAAGVAYEINNPLFIIRSYLQMLKEMNLGEASSANLDNMDREMTRIADIVGSLISFSKIKELPENRISIGEVLEDVLLLLEHNISIKGIRLERERESFARERRKSWGMRTGSSSSS